MFKRVMEYSHEVSEWGYKSAPRRNIEEMAMMVRTAILWTVTVVAVIWMIQLSVPTTMA